MGSIYAYLSLLTPQELFHLYESPWCAIAVHQSLPALAKQLVMRFLCIKSPISESFIRSCWFKPVSTIQEDIESALRRVLELAILGKPPGATVQALGLNGSEETAFALAINGIFASSLQRAVASEEEVPWEAVTSRLPRLLVEPAVADIEKYAAARWNAILHFMVNSYDAPPPAPKVLELLVSTGLLAPGAGGDDEDDEWNANDPEWLPRGSAAASSDAATGSAKAMRRSVRFEDVVKDGGNGRSGVVHMTRAGYEFLLKDTSVQLWTFMNQYLATATERGMRASDILAFLFELGFCKLGQGYAIAAVTDTQRHLLQEFASFGLVYIPDNQKPSITSASAAAHAIQAERSSGWGSAGDDPSSMSAASSSSGAVGDHRRFYPTSLAIILTQPDAAAVNIADTFTLSGGAGGSSSGVAEGASSADTRAAAAVPTAVQGGSDIQLHLIVEKNFKVYAYTSVDLHIALLALISKIEVRMPNVVIATLTRRAVMQAYERGITANLIIHFLRQRVHPTVASRGLSVPENVCDQLILWERERHRVTFRTAVLLDGFDTLDQFREVARFARDSAALLFAKEEDMSLALFEGAWPHVRDYMRSRGIIAAATAGGGGAGI